MNRFQCVADLQRLYSVKRLRSILGVSRSSFYYWRRTATDRAARQVADAKLPARIRAVHQESDGTDGSPRITAELREENGVAVNHKRVARIMQPSGIEGVRLLRRHRTTVPDPTTAKAPGPDPPRLHRGQAEHEVRRRHHLPAHRGREVLLPDDCHRPRTTPSDRRAIADH
ncbi:IS3 family transposase [Streptomyces sp. NPDC051784]|uniref:IS3 family transposase n=1 Tax=Streptomyces sp. NPDC051784 TaxID=3155805 RepID=UPI003446CAD6